MEDQEFINQLAEKLSKLGTVRPLGFHYLHPYETVPADSIICNGSTYSRALYKDFFDYITTQGWVKTEAEWQKIATRDNGFCPFYSSGDGSTNFRTPKFAPYQQVTMEVATATAYHQAGLPNITGDWNTRGPEILENATGGAFSVEETSDNYGWEHSLGGPSPKLKFKASSSSSVYGRSSTVQPESHEWVMCVVAYCIATNVGSMDIQNVMPAVNAVQASLENIVHIAETWKSTDGSSWYRVWSDGFIEQGGHYTSSDSSKFTVTLNKQMKTTYYHCDVPGGYNASTERGWGFAYDKTTSNFKAVVVEPKGTWEVRGY